MKPQTDELENKNFHQTFQEYILELLTSICNRHIKSASGELEQQQLGFLKNIYDKDVELNSLSELLSSLLYDFCRKLQNETSFFCTFDLVQKACDSIREKLDAVRYCKWNRLFNKNYNNVYHKLLKRSLDPSYCRTSDDSNRDFKIIFPKFERTINIWAHHVPYDDFDVDKSYNEPPQVQIIRFDMTGDVIITGGSEGIIKLWDLHTCKSIMTLKKHTGAISSIDVHPTNSFIVSCCEGGEIWLWEISFNFYRPHRMLKSTYKYLWVRFLVNGQKQDLVDNRHNNNDRDNNNNGLLNQRNLNNRMDYHDRVNWNKCLEATLIVSLDANSILRVYRMTDLLGSSSGDNIYTEVTPLYYVDLFDHNITAYDLSKCAFNGTFLTAIGIEPLDAQDLDNADMEEINNSLNYIKNDTFHKANINIKGRYRDLIGKSGFALLMIPLTDPSETSKGDENTNDHINNNSNNKDNNIKDQTTLNNQTGCETKTNNSDHGYQNATNQSTDYSNRFCYCDCSRNATSTCINVCIYCGKQKYTENRRSVLSITHHEGDEDVELPSAPKSMFVWVSHNSSEIEKFFVDCLPEFSFYEAALFQSYTPGVPTMHYGKFSSSVILPASLGSGGGNVSDSVDFDKLFLNFVKNAHVQSPDVCFANTSANHMSASDDGMVYLWSYQAEKFKSVQLTTKTMERWRNTTAFKNEANKSDLKNTSLPNSNFDILVEREPSSLKSTQRQKASPFGSNYKSILNKDLSKKTGVESENKDGSGNVSSNAIYMVVELSWSTNDKYVCVADSIVTKHNYRKPVTQARTIYSGLSFFSNQGRRLSDFLHESLSFHVSCASFHPVCEEVCLVACYDGLIAIVDVVSGSVLKKMTFGPTSIWMDVQWHPMGHKFVACQKYGAFSLFSTDPKTLVERTPNYQSTYLDYYSNSLSYCNSAYAGPESNTVKLKRYYSSFSNAPITLNGDSTYEKVNKSLNGGPVVFLDEHKNNVVVHTSGGVRRCRLLSYLPNCDENTNDGTNDHNNNKRNENDGEGYRENNSNKNSSSNRDQTTHNNNKTTYLLYSAMCTVNGFREYFEAHYNEDENVDPLRIMNQFIHLIELVNENGRSGRNNVEGGNYSSNHTNRENNNKDSKEMNGNTSGTRRNNNKESRENKMNKYNSDNYYYYNYKNSKENNKTMFVNYQKNQSESVQEVSDYRCYLGECTVCENYLTLNEQHSKYLSVKDSFVQLKTFTDRNGLILRALPPSARPQDLLDSLDAEQTVTPARRMDPSSYINTGSSRSTRVIVTSSSEEPLVGVGLVLPTSMFSESNILENSVTFDSNSEINSVRPFKRTRVLTESTSYELRDRDHLVHGNENDGEGYRENQYEETGNEDNEEEEEEEEELEDDEFELGRESELEESDEDSSELTSSDEDELMAENYKRRSSRLAKQKVNRIHSPVRNSETRSTRRSSRLMRMTGVTKEPRDQRSRVGMGRENRGSREFMDRSTRGLRETRVEGLDKGDEEDYEEYNEDQYEDEYVERARRAGKSRKRGRWRLKEKDNIGKGKEKNKYKNRGDKDFDKNKERYNKGDREFRDKNKDRRKNKEEEKEKQDSYSFRSKRGYDAFTNEKEVESAKNLSMNIGPIVVKYLGINSGSESESKYMSRTCVFCGMGRKGDYSKLTRNQTQKFSSTIFSSRDSYNPGCKLFEDVMLGPMSIPNKYIKDLSDFTLLFKRIEESSEIFSHVSCLLVSGVKMDSSNRLMNLLEVLVKSSFEECKFCESKFASVRCVRCGSWYHYPCSIAEYIGYRKEVKGLEIFNYCDALVSNEYICVGCGVKYNKDYLNSECFLKSESRKWLMDEYDRFENKFNIQIGDSLVLTEEVIVDKLNVHVTWITQKEFPVVVKVVDISYVFNGESNVMACLLVESLFGEFDKLCFFITEQTRVVLLRDYFASIYNLSRIEVGCKVRCKLEGVVFESEVKSFRFDYTFKDMSSSNSNKSEHVVEIFDMEFFKKIVKGVYYVGHNSVSVLVDNRAKWVSTWDLEYEGDLFTEIKSHTFLESDKQKLLELIGDKKIEVFYSIDEYKPGCFKWIYEYWKVISRPIGTKEITEKLFNVYYRSPYGVIGDLMLVVTNCVNFNVPNSHYTKTANYLKSAVDKIKSNLQSEEEWTVVLPLLWPKIKGVLDLCLVKIKENKEKMKVKPSVVDEEIEEEEDDEEDYEGNESGKNKKNKEREKDKYKNRENRYNKGDREERNKEKEEYEEDQDDEEVCLEDEGRQKLKRRSGRLEKLRRNNRRSSRLVNNVHKIENKKNIMRKERKKSRYNFR